MAMLSTRRSLLRSLGLLGAGAALSPLWAPRPAFANTGIDPDRAFVFVFFDGGWDVTMSLDPRDPAQFPDSAKDQTRIELGWSRLAPQFRQAVQRSNMTFGPAIGRTAEHHDVLTVVRGMTMETLTHAVGARFFLTGKTPAGLTARGNSAGAELVHQLAAARPVTAPIPNLHVDTEAYYSGETPAARPYRAGAANAYALVNAFVSGIGDPADNFLALMRGTAQSSLLDGYRASAPACDPTGLSARGAHRELREAQAKVSEMLRGNLGAAFDFQNLQRPEMAALHSRYGSAVLGSSGAAAAVAYQALKYGISRCVTVRLQKNLDTHTSRWAADQPALLKEGFDALGALLADLRTTPHPTAGGTLFDHTTLVVFSEFSRTPYLNASFGRDHSLTNCCVLAGAGVPRGRVVGASSDVGMEPQPVDAVTGQVRLDAAGRMLRPPEVLASVFAAAGYSTDPFRGVEPLPCLRS